MLSIIDVIDMSQNVQQLNALLIESFGLSLEDAKKEELITEGDYSHLDIKEN